MNDIPKPADFRAESEVVPDTDSVPAPRTPRWDGWTPPTQRAFLEALAETGSVRQSCLEVNMAWRTAYALRHRRDGFAFAVGWEAALLVARGRLADTLMERAIEGETLTITREETREKRHRHDNRLALGMLTRLDRMTATPNGRVERYGWAAARDFELWLEIVENGLDAETSEAMLHDLISPPKPAPKPQPAPAPAQCDLHDDDDDEEDNEMTLAEDYAADLSCWWDGKRECFVTDFPPPLDFDGWQSGKFDEDGYYRACTPKEEVAMIAREAQIKDPDYHDAAIAARDAFFGFAGGDDLAAFADHVNSQIDKLKQADAEVCEIEAAAEAQAAEAAAEGDGD